MSGKNSHKSYVLFQRGFLVTGFEAKRIYFSTCRKKNGAKYYSFSPAKINNY